MRTDNKSSEKAVENQAEKVTKYQVIRNNRKPQGFPGDKVEEEEEKKLLNLFENREKQHLRHQEKRRKDEKKKEDSGWDSKRG